MLSLHSNLSEQCLHNSTHSLQLVLFVVLYWSQSVVHVSWLVAHMQMWMLFTDMVWILVDRVLCRQLMGACVG